MRQTYSRAADPAGLTGGAVGGGGGADAHFRRRILIMRITPKLTDMQIVLLANASQREGGSIFPPPRDIKNGTARFRQSISGLIERNLATEVDANDQTVVQCLICCGARQATKSFRSIFP